MIIYKCRKCGYIIYTYRYGDDYYGVPSPRELKIRITSRCPNCNRELLEKIEQFWISIEKARAEGLEYA